MKDLTIFNELQAKISLSMAPVFTLSVSDSATSEQAIDHVKSVKNYKDEVEKNRQALIAPLMEQIKEVNTYVSNVLLPLKEAEAHLRSELNHYAAIVEQERVRKESEAREKKRLEALALAQKHENELRQDESSGHSLNPDLTLGQALERKSMIENSEREMSVARVGSICGARKVWKCELVDIKKVPEIYVARSLNEKMVLAAARGGVTEIPGVRVWQETQVAIGSNTRVR